MCVIVYKPQNETLKRSTLHQMWSANPDGAGIAYFDRGEVQIVKGLMRLRDLVATLRDLGDAEAVIHFRYATHGSKTADMTHPFAVSHDRDTALNAESASAAIVHNGVIPGYGLKDLSDTAQFVIDTLAHVPHLATRLDVLNLVSGSRFAYLDSQQRQVYLIGKFEKLKNGVYVSNTYWDMRSFLGAPTKREGLASAGNVTRIDDWQWESDDLRCGSEIDDMLLSETFSSGEE